MAKRFDGHVAVANAAQSATRFSANLDLVLTDDPRFFALANLYAHLTNRSGARLVSTIAGVDEFPDADVMIVRAAGLSPELIEAASRRSRPLGVLFADHENQLRRIVLLRSAALRFRSTNPSRDRSLYPTLDIDIAEAGTDRQVVGGLSLAMDKPFPSDALPTNILTLLTHGDGIDAFLGRRSVCAVPDLRSKIIDRAGAPSCVIRGVCYRNRTPIDEARAMGLLVPPQILSSYVLVLMSCWGLNTEPSIVDQRWSFVRALQESPLVGSIVTTWKIVLPSPADLEQLYQTIRSSAHIGDAVANFNRRQSAAKSGLEVCIIGDPRVKPKTLPNVASLDWSGLASRPKIALGNVNKGPVEFISGYLTVIADRLKAEQHELYLRTIRSLPRVRGKAKQSRMFANSPSGGAQSLARNLVRLVAARGTLPSKDWITLARHWSVVPSKHRCFVCSARTETYRARLALVKRYMRCFVNCPRCGIVLDFHNYSDAPLFSLKGRSIRLARRCEGQAAVLSIESDWRDEKRIIEWPVIQQRLVPELALPEDLNSGFCYVTIFKSSGLDLEVARMPINLDVFGARATPAAIATMQSDCHNSLEAR